MQFTAFERFRTIVAASIGDVPQPEPEEQNGDYESGAVTIDSQLCRIRTARVTPVKPGAFVAVWTRDSLGATRPFDTDDRTDGLLVFVVDGERFGLFRFTAPYLERLGITRSASQPGKRGFRVYPEWSTGLNPQAKRTQREQAEAFIDLEPDRTHGDAHKLGSLFV